jgi:DNA-directed RNA polymerase subunit RPC12/RpoP
MQFRYLKSFKKHRLNHALERLHGKKDKHGDNEPVSSTNENEGVDLSGIKDEENISEDEDQDNTIDSVGAHSSDHLRIGHDRLSTISSSATESAGCDTDALRNEPEPSSSLTSLTTLINSETIPNQQLLGLNPQEASILNFLRVDAAEKQRDRRFACPFCGKCVRSKENLKLHVRKHTGERPFVCLFCGRAFGGKSDLTRHLRIHTGERPYHCEACGKCFARADYLSKHLTTHVHNGPRG